MDPVQGVERGAEVEVEDGRIRAVVRREGGGAGGPYILPGLVDAHVHVESSLLPPSEFARAAVVHGTVASVSDPHEIANVLGEEGVRYMVEDGRRQPFKFHFGAPSCVPATDQETAGARFDAQAVDRLFTGAGALYLAEVMNFPAVVNRDPSILAILETARSRGLRIDGHAPGLAGEGLRLYAGAGIETDHECVTLQEARDRVAVGMKVAIREGSAARDFEALWPLLEEAPDSCFFCSDDKHPDALLEGHVNQLVARAIARGVSPMSAIRAATLNPVRHYGLPVGLLQPGDPADLLETDSLDSLHPRRVWIDGRLVAEDGRSLLPPLPPSRPNRFRQALLAAGDLRLAGPAEGPPVARVIQAIDGQIRTRGCWQEVKLVDGAFAADPGADLLKMVVVNRYSESPPQVAIVSGFGIKRGALASSVAHDSHNVIAVGADDSSLLTAVNGVIAEGGGLSVADGGEQDLLPLPIAGLMSDLPHEEVARRYGALDRRARLVLGSTLRSPFMTLSFMALLVIPELKLSDLGLFDVAQFRLCPLWRGN